MDKWIAIKKGCRGRGESVTNRNGLGLYPEELEESLIEEVVGSEDRKVSVARWLEGDRLESAQGEIAENVRECQRD